MKHRLLLPIIALLFVPLCRADEPVYAGKPLAFWIDELKSGDPLIREEAVLVLSEAGPAARAAMPRLQELCKDHERGVRLRAALAVWRISGETKPAIAALTEALHEKALANRAEILGKLGELGREAASSAAIVLPFFDDTDPAVRAQATRSITSFGAKSVSALLNALDDANPRLRRNASAALRVLGSAAEQAVPKLTALLDKEDEEARLEALNTLGSIGAAARSAAPAIRKLTGNRDARLRAAALAALQQVGPDPKLARPAALEALEDKDLRVRAQGVILLGQVDPQNPDVLPHVLELLKQPVGRSELLLLLGRMGPRAAPAVPQLTKLLADVDASTRRLVVQALGSMGPAARPAVPALLKQLRAAEFMSRQTTMIALRAIGGESDRVVPAVMEVAKQDFTTRSISLPLLADYGPKAAAAVPWLVEELGRPPSFLTVQTAETLHKIDPEVARKKAVPVLRKMLAKGAAWRVYAAMALRRLQPDSEEGLNALIDCVTSNDLGARQQACQVLGTLGKSAREAAPALRKVLRDPSLYVRVLAATALWKIDGETETTVPVLLEALKPSPSNYWRYQAVNVLGEMGPAVKVTALPALRIFRDDADPVMRGSVSQAIQRIEGSAGPAKTP